MATSVGFRVQLLLPLSAMVYNIREEPGLAMLLGLQCGSFRK